MDHSSRSFEQTEIVGFLLDPSDRKSDGYESPLGYHGVDVEGVTSSKWITSPLESIIIVG